MKYLLALLSTLFLASFAHADFGRNMVWRSTETCSAETAVVSTGPIRVFDITVTSGSPTGTTFQYYNSTTTIASLFGSSSTVMDMTSRSYPPITLDEILDDGFLYVKIGVACVRIRWNWESHINKHQAGLGLK